MEKYGIEKDINVACLTAGSFPAGVEAAHTALHEMLPSMDKRTFYGISYPDETGRIIYKAAATLLEGEEAQRYGLETFIIRKGEYMSELLLNFCEDAGRVGETFQKLLALPELDPQGYCLELYLSDKDMRCMVPLKK